MPAYFIAEVDIHDPVRYEDYKKLVPPTVAKYGGRFIVRGGTIRMMEGGPEPKRMVIIEFPDAEKARAWWASPDYAGPKAMRHASATTRALIVEGA